VSAFQSFSKRGSVETGKQIMRLLRIVVQSEGRGPLVATHDPNLIGIADPVVELEDGTIKGNR
jgi:putative ABC transport system ATP-binding protein